MVSIYSFNEELNVFGPVVFCLITGKEEILYTQMLKEISFFFKEDYGKLYFLFCLFEFLKGLI